MASRSTLGSWLLLFILLIILAGVAALGYVNVRRSFPQTSGEIIIPELNAPVEILRDDLGVVHIYASTSHDLFLAQGFVQAQDRFWQMDFQRHVGAGRLSELVGSGGLDTDLFLRTLGWERVAQEEISRLPQAKLEILQAYADGVNAYLVAHSGTEISLEYAFISLINNSYRPQPWQPLHTATWAKAMAWRLGSNMDAEIERAVLLGTLSEEQVADLYPEFPADNPTIIAGYDQPQLAGQTMSTPSSISSITPLLRALQSQVARLDGVLGVRDDGIGSNSWVIHGALSATGAPLLANDPHLGAQMPAIWYENGLHCQPKGPDCPYDLVGFSLLGTPGIVIGHNDRIAWGFTDISDDVQDLYIERVNPENSNQYQRNGEWVEMAFLTESIVVPGAGASDLTVRFTEHGPIISDVFGALEDFETQAGIELPEQYVISLRWTALEPSTILEAILDLNLAQNWDEFRQAARLFDVPAQNLIYADVDGNIGYQTPGRIPIRAGGDGLLPAPGWTDEFEWTGFIPFDELPSLFNPPQGYIVTANNAIIGPGYPHSIGRIWDYGFRARRIVDLIENAPGPITPEYIEDMQGDSYNLSAETFVPLLQALPAGEARLDRALGLLDGWDGQMSMDSAPAALYGAFWRHLLIETFHDDLPAEFHPEGGSGWFEITRRLAADPDSPWWDNQNTPEVEDQTAILQRSLLSAVDELEDRLGTRYESWAWGDLHTITFRNEVMDNFPLVNMLFNRGPFRSAGSSSTVNNTNWDAAQGYSLEGSVPSMRMIVDLSDLTHSRTIVTTGQSGHAYHPHYIDMADLWRSIEYHPMRWTRSQVEEDQESNLILSPGE